MNCYIYVVSGMNCCVYEVTRDESFCLCCEWDE